MHLPKKAAVVAATAFMLIGIAVPTAVAAGADGGDFSCSLSGVPAWGYVHSDYKHPSRKHYATAVGSSQQTIHADAGKWAKATTGRTGSGNHCYYGFDS
jgi:lactococcin 972 family bacteriocin